ncbi:MAG: hypothetical protein RIT28_2366 [Pseudomonadota bacterium]
MPPPTYTLNSASMATARSCLEYCRFAYKAYAQSAKFPMDPFFETWGEGFRKTSGARDRLMKHIHDVEHTLQSSDNRKFDPILYHLDRTPNPHDGVVYRGDIDDSFILFQPRALDKRIAHARCYNRFGRRADDGHALQGATGNLRCGYFQGKTGMTENHPTSGWPSLLGAVIYDPGAQEVTIVFRGSRSGDGTRAALGAQLKSRGSPDWVTDLNHLKPIAVDKYGGHKLSIGFHLAYESCAISLQKAYTYAVNGGAVRKIQVTGHSLGGALAQNAYLDLTCGTLGRTLGVQDGRVALSCVPISSPPVLIGIKAQRWASLYADAAAVHHFYNPRDAVHACDLLADHSKSFVFGATKALTHPINSPRHFGSQTALSAPDDFPIAHEPEAVWRGMHDGVLDPKFWPVFRLDITSPTPRVTGLPEMSLTLPLKRALANSCSIRSSVQQAELWRAVVKDEDRRHEARLNRRAVQGLELPDNFDVLQHHEALRALQETRAELIKGYGTPGKHSASSSVYYNLLLGLTVRYLTAGALI